MGGGVAGRDDPAHRRFEPQIIQGIDDDGYFLPALYPLALRDADEPTVLFNRGIDLGSVSMLSFRLG